MFSDCVEIVHTVDKGRAFIAKKCIGKGTVIVMHVDEVGQIVLIQEKPVASVLQAQHITKRCHFCWKLAEEKQNLLRCSSCKYTRYCSIDCQVCLFW